MWQLNTKNRKGCGNLKLGDDKLLSIIPPDEATQTSALAIIVIIKFSPPLPLRLNDDYLIATSDITPSSFVNGVRHEAVVQWRAGYSSDDSSDKR